MEHCPKCNEYMERATRPDDLPTIPPEWFIKNHGVLNNEVILYCEDCGIFKILHGIQKVIYIYNPLRIL